MTVKPIRSEADYDAALKEAKRLIVKHDQRSIDTLDVLQTLIERWEERHHSLEAATPAEAIKFRMDQLNLKPRDLVALLGSKSRVSEILNGQRQPTVDQIRALHQHIGVPVASLIGTIKHESAIRQSAASQAAVEKLRSLRVMKPNEDFPTFMARATSVAPAISMLRKSRTDRTNAKTDFGALEAWCAAVLLAAEHVKVAKRASTRWTAKNARELATLSASDDWHKRVREALAEQGIILVVLDHLPGTFLDGAAICRGDGAPIIALTLRHNRIDNFWFTLLHEYAHVACHLSGDLSIILDDLDVNSSDGLEAEADEFARNALIPPALWKRHASPDMSMEDVETLAKAASVHEAIVAGRWRWEHGDYRRFSRILGAGQVRGKLK